MLRKIRYIHLTPNHDYATLFFSIRMFWGGVQRFPVPQHSIPSWFYEFSSRLFTGFGLHSVFSCIFRPISTYLGFGDAFEDHAKALGSFAEAF